MLVTINTDAAFHSQHNVGAYAFWIVCNQGKICHSGALKGKIKDSSEAEAMCIINALHALHRSRITNVTKVIINSDSLHFMKYVSKRPHLLKPLHQVFILVVNKYGLRKGWYEFRHVKSHSGKEEKRKWVNDWCDKAAKEMLWNKINNPWQP